jgi:hypothetical protein
MKTLVTYIVIGLVLVAVVFGYMQIAKKGIGMQKATVESGRHQIDAAKKSVELINEQTAKQAEEILRDSK